MYFKGRDESLAAARNRFQPGFLTAELTV